MFNKEEFINNYIEVLKDETKTDAHLTELTSQLPTDMESSFYTGLVQDIIFELKNDKEFDGTAEIKRLENTVSIMRLMQEISEENSDTVEAKDASKAEEVTQDVTADSVAVASEGEVAVEETATNLKEEAVGEAPAEEAKVEKSEKEKS